MHKHLHACPHLHALSASFGIQPIMHSIDFEYGKVKILVFHRMFSLFFFFPSICLSSKHYKNTKDLTASRDPFQRRLAMSKY